MDMGNVLSTAVESTPLDQIEPIEPSDLTTSNLKSLLTDLVPEIRSLAFNIVVCIVIYIAGKKLIALVHRMLQKALERSQADVGLVRFLGSALDIVLHIFLIFMILGQLGINTASIFTVLGALLLAVGMSLQGSLSNVAGGILILLMRPFQVGHYIVCDYGEGTVTMIGLVYTTLTTKDNRILTIPNSQISNCAVTNCTRNPVRRLDLVVGISYEADLRQAKELMRKVCDECEYIQRDRPVSIFVDSLGDSAVNMGLYAYVPSSDFLAAKWQVTENLKLCFDAGGISIPFPQVQVHMDHMEEKEGAETV